MINVSENGVADYNNPVTIPIDSPLYGSVIYERLDNHLEAVIIIKDAIGSK